MSEKNCFDYCNQTNNYIFNDESHYFLNSFDENKENYFSQIISNMDIEQQIPSSNKRTNFEDNIEKDNLLKYNEDDNKMFSNDLIKIQENNILPNENEEEEIIDEIFYNNVHNNLVEFEDRDNRINPNFQISPDNNIIDKDEEEEEIIDKTIIQNNTEKIKNTKYTPENLLRKVKHILLECILLFLNKIICKVYNNQIGNGIAIKQFKNLNQKEKSEPSIQYNKDFLNKTIGEILSEKISKRMTNYSPFHNKNLVEKLLNENNITIKKIFQKLFNLTFFDYLEHFRGTKPNDILKGMPSINKAFQKYSDDPDYITNLNYYFQNYDIIINKKKSRKSKKKKGN